jgi:hypothetical protein
MTDDLVKRLREQNDLRMLTASMPPLPVKDWLCNAAADRIEQLEAALQNIVIHCESDSPPNAEALKLFARAALGEKKDGN